MLAGYDDWQNRALERRVMDADLAVSLRDTAQKLHVRSLEHRKPNGTEQEDLGLIMLALAQLVEATLQAERRG